jgi:hypothetical protein
MSLKRRVGLADERHYVLSHTGAALGIPAIPLLSSDLMRDAHRTLKEKGPAAYKRRFLPAAHLETITAREMWVETPLGEDWVVAYRVVAQGGEPVIGEVRVIPYEPDQPINRPAGRWWGSLRGTTAVVPAGGLTARLLRQAARSGPVAEVLRKLIADLREELTPEEDISRTLGGLPVPPHEEASSKRGRKSRPLIEYAEIAQAFVNARIAGSRKPVVAVAKALRIPAGKARGLIRKAREHQLLGWPRKQGVVGGNLTAKARDILKTGTRRRKRTRRGRRTER